MNTLQRKEERLRLLQCKYRRLAELPEDDRTLDQVDEMLELTEMIDKLEKCIEQQRRKAAVTEDEASAAEEAAQAMMASFVETFAIWFTAETGSSVHFA